MSANRHSYQKPNKETIEQIDPMDRGDCQPGTCGHRRPGISRHDPIAWNIEINGASQYGDQ
jgi:hypothetical protein